MILENGQSLPPLIGTDPDGNDVAVADLVAGSWGAILLYRGHW